MARGPRRKTLLDRLLAQAEDPQVGLNRLIIGCAGCFVGMGLVLGAEYLYPGSLTGELVALGGVITIAIGLGFLAAGYLGLSVLRIWRLIADKRQPPDDKQD